MTTELEHLFDAAGRQAPTSDGWNPDDVIARGGRRRNTRRALTAVGALVTATALVLGATTFVPKGNVDVAPVDGGRTTTLHYVLDGLDITTTGPAVLHLRDSYPITATFRNTTTSDWVGSVGVSIHHPKGDQVAIQFDEARIDERPIGNTSSLVTVDSEAYSFWVGHVLQGGEPVSIRAGKTVTLTANVKRSNLMKAFPPSIGWMPAIHEGTDNYKHVGSPGDGAVYAPVASNSPVTADPIQGDPSCSSLSSPMQKLVSSQPRLSSAIVTTSNSPLQPKWVLGGPEEGQVGWGFGIISDLSSYVVDAELVMQSIQAAGGPALDGIDSKAWVNPLKTASTIGMKPGHTYVAFNGSRYDSIEFRAVCSPDSTKRVSGTFQGGETPQNGFLDCAVEPEPGLLYSYAAFYCPSGTLAKKFGKESPL